MVRHHTRCSLWLLHNSCHIQMFYTIQVSDKTIKTKIRVFKYIHKYCLLDFIYTRSYVIHLVSCKYWFNTFLTALIINHMMMMNCINNKSRHTIRWRNVDMSIDAILNNDLRPLNFAVRYPFDNHFKSCLYHKEAS